MGGGNAQKSAIARAKNLEKAKKAGGGQSQLASNAKASSILCNICKQSFICTAKGAVLQAHVDSKHAKLSIAECFPGVEI
jgi:hypothetical protein